MQTLRRASGATSAGSVQDRCAAQVAPPAQAACRRDAAPCSGATSAGQRADAEPCKWRHQRRQRADATLRRAVAPPVQGPARRRCAVQWRHQCRPARRRCAVQVGATSAGSAQTLRRAVAPTSAGSAQIEGFNGRDSHWNRSDEFIQIHFSFA